MRPFGSADTTECGAVRTMFDKAFIQELARAIAVEVAKIMDSTPKVSPRYLNLEQAAVYLNTTKDGVRGMARAKLFPIKKAGSRTFIDIHDIDEAMQSNTAWAAMEESIENYVVDEAAIVQPPQKPD
jgi:hypothetical protein